LGATIKKNARLIRAKKLYHGRHNKIGVKVTNNNVDEFYTDEENYMFIREVIADPFLSIFMTCEREKEQEKYDKSEELMSGVLSFHNKHRSMLMMKSVAFIMGCFVLVLRMGEWNELTRHPKDRGKNQPNSRTNSLQQGENDANCVAVNLFYFLN
jgi:hypothetical protein